MADNDPYGLFGDEAEASTTARKRQRTRTRARDVEQPSSVQKVDDAEPADPYGLFAGEDAPAAAPDADLSHGRPPGAAGQEHAPNQREHAWYEPFLDSAQSFLQGATLNVADEAAGATRWALGKTGLMRDVGSLEENMDVMKADADRVTRDYPIAHGAGQMATGIAAGMAAPQGALTQGAVQGLLSAGSEYADSGDLASTGVQGAVGLGVGTAGGWLGNQVAKRLAVADPIKNAILRGPVSPEDMAKAPTPDILTRRQAPRELVSVLESRPRPLPNELPAGGYDPLAAQQMATPAGVPRPLPVPQGSGAAPPPDAVAKLLRGSNGKFQKILPMELDTTPAARMPSMPSEGSAYGGQWDVNLPADAPLDFAPRPRVGSAPPIESTPSLPPIEARRVPTGPIDPIDIGPARWDVASRAQRQAATPPGATLDNMLAIGSHVPGLSLPSRLGRAGLRALGGPDVAAREAGVYLNDPARQLARGGVEAAWELGAPALTGSKVNAQDGEQTAYASSPTLNYALSATLHAGRTGLPPADEQALTSAVVSGDDKAIAAIDFRLKQKYPAYARQVERALRDLNEGEE